MTAGGGWLEHFIAARRSGHKPEVLPVTHTSVVVNLSRCSGACCRAVTLHGPQGYLTPEELAAAAAYAAACHAGQQPEEGWLDRTGERHAFSYDQIDQVAAMMKPVGEAVDPHGRPTYHFGCKNVLPDGRCGIYADRPRMCRSFAERWPCDFAGSVCTYRKQVNPLVPTRTT